MDAARRSNSAREAGVEAIGFSLQRGPSEEVCGHWQPDSALLRGNLRRALRWIVEIVPSRQSHDLRLARALEIVEPDEAFADIFADRQRAVVAQEHGILGSQI